MLICWTDDATPNVSEIVVNPSLLSNLIADLPKFVEPLQNVTIPVGREAVFSCSIENLQTYKVYTYAPLHCFIVLYYGQWWVVDLYKERKKELVVKGDHFWPNLSHFHGGGGR